MKIIKIIFAFLIFINNAGAQVDLQKGLLAYYPFSGDAKDHSGNNNHGIIKGASLTADRNGELNSAYYFNGSDSVMIVIPHSEIFNFHDTLTFSLWYKYDLENKKPRSTLFNKGGNSETDYWGFRRYDYGEFIFYNVPDEQWGAWLGQSWQNLEDGNWHWIGIRFHSKGHQTFVDGETTGGGSSAFDKFLSSNDSSLVIGNVEGLENRGWSGSIDELRFYKRYLNTTEMARLYGDFTGIDHNPLLNGKYFLTQNYPNPFNPSTTIKYTIPNQPNDVVNANFAFTTNVTLTIYDILGREVQILVNEHQSPGEYQIEFNCHSGACRNLPSGVYFYRLQTDNFIETKKMILLR